jgi:hypothetical protein
VTVLLYCKEHEIKTKKLYFLSIQTLMGMKDNEKVNESRVI